MKLVYEAKNVDSFQLVLQILVYYGDIHLL